MRFCSSVWCSGCADGAAGGGGARAPLTGEAVAGAGAPWRAARFAAAAALISAILAWAAAFFASRSFAAGGAGLGIVAAGAGAGAVAVGGAVTPFGALDAAALAFSAAMRAAASCFFLSSSDMPFAGAAEGEPLFERMRLSSWVSASLVSCGRLPVILD